MAFFSIESAATYIKDRIRQVYRQTPILKDQLIGVSQIIGRLKRMPQIQTTAKLKEAERLRQSIIATIHAQTKLETEVYPWARFFGVDASLGTDNENLGLLPVIPILLAATAIGMAGMMVNQFAKIKNQQRSLELIARGVMTPAEAAALKPKGILEGVTGALGGVQNIAMIAALGLGVFLLMSMQRRTA